MRIAQVSTLYESVPPKGYGGTERVVSWLTEALVDAGHDVTLFASADSVTRARLTPGCPCALRLIEETADPQAFHFAMLEHVVRRSGEFDVVHFHTDYLGFPFARRLKCAHVTTLHWRLDIPGLDGLYRAFDDIPLVSISDAQRAPLPQADWRATVYHGMPTGTLTFNAQSGDYLAFLGRIAPHKRPDLAIEIAERAGLPLRMAAKIDNGDRSYYEANIETLLQHPHVDYLGELTDGDKHALLAGARALLFPIDWPEPFGLVLIEALACGTPVIAYRRGSVPEIIEDRRTGFIVDDVDGAVRAIAHLAQIDRAQCRAAFEARFSAARMAADYQRVYEAVLAPAGRRDDARPVASLQGA